MDVCCHSVFNGNFWITLPLWLSLTHAAYDATSQSEYTCHVRAAPSSNPSFQFQNGGAGTLFLHSFISTVHPWCLERFMLLQQDVTSANVCSSVATFERGIFRTKPDFSFPEGMKMQIIWSSWLTISCFGIKRRNNAFLFFSLLFFFSEAGEFLKAPFISGAKCHCLDFTVWPFTRET